MFTLCLLVYNACPALSALYTTASSNNLFNAYIYMTSGEKATNVQ